MHIYHSALLLAPKSSIVRKLYASHIHPLSGVIHGAPISWDTNAAITHHHEISSATWSPCNRFIAVISRSPITVGVLDAVTLQQLQTLECPMEDSPWCRLIFSPNSQIITCCDGLGKYVVSWDLQTGGVVSTIEHKEQPGVLIRGTYSADGRTVGVYRLSCRLANSSAIPSYISIYDITSGTHTHSFPLNGDSWQCGSIWTQGESFQFTTLHGTNIVIWEVGFALDAIPMEFGVFPIPGGFNGHKWKYPQVRLFPTPHRLVLASEVRVMVWDSQSFRVLLDGPGVKYDRWMSFSSDGHFFAYRTFGQEIYLWKESPTGYILHASLEPSAKYPKPILSPNGQSIVVFGEHIVQLWHTKDLTTPTSNNSTQTPQNAERFSPMTNPGNFIMDFSPDGVLAVATRRGDNIITVLNIRSGIPQLTINVGMEVYGLRVMGDAIIVVCHLKVTAWNLSTGDCIPSVRVGLEGSPWTESLDDLQPSWNSHTSVSISPDFHHIVICTGLWTYIYNTSTGVRLTHAHVPGTIPWFSPDGHDLWAVQDNGGAYVQKPDGTWDAGNRTLRLLKDRLLKGYRYHWQVEEYTGVRFGVQHPPEGFPWGSPHGYQVTNNWWVLGPSGGRLLMLPPAWQSPFAVQRMWNSHFLALLHCELPEPVILDLDVQH